MEFGIHALQIRESDLSPENHLVKANDEVGIQKPSMVDRKPHDTTDELEVV